MFTDELERFGSFDLQLFADDDGEPAPETTETPTEPTEPTGDEPTTDPEDESFIDESLIPDEMKQSAHFKGMKSAYTRKTQEIAEFKRACKDAGLSPQQAAVMLKRLQEDPHGLAELIRPKPKNQDKQEPAKDTSNDELDEFADDEYALKLLEVAEKRTLTKAEQKIVDAVMKKLGPQLQTVESIQRREAMEFKKQVDDSIKKVLKDFPEAKLTHDQLFKVAAKHEIEPAAMENALAIALGPAKYRELIQKKALADASRKIQDNIDSVGPVMGSGDGSTDKAPFNGPPKSFDDATERALKKYGG